jgi:hypothetical protein
MAKKINHRGHGGHRELLFSLCPLCSLWFSKPIPEDNKKSPFVAIWWGESCECHLTNSLLVLLWVLLLLALVSNFWDANRCRSWIFN